MCQPASFIVTKDKVFWSKESDSHEVIEKEHQLHIDGVRGANAVKVEITPAALDFTLPLEQWVFKTDQDDTPKWFDAKDAETRVRQVLPEWLAHKVVLPGQHVETLEHKIIACYGTIQCVCGGTIQYVYGGTIQSVYGGTIQSVYGGTIQSVNGGTIQSVRGGTIQSVNGGTIQSVDGDTIQSVRGGTIQSVRGGTIQYVYGGTIQSVYGGTIQSVYGGTIQSVDGGTIQSVRGGTIQSVYSGTIQSVRGGTIQSYTSIDPAILKSSRAVLIDRSGDVVKCYVGADRPTTE